MIECGKTEDDVVKKKDLRVRELNKDAESDQAEWKSTHHITQASIDLLILMIMTNSINMMYVSSQTNAGPKNVWYVFQKHFVIIRGHGSIIL